MTLVASDKPLRWGFLGAGWIADIIATDFKHAGLTINAVGARSGEASSAFAAKHGIPSAYEGYDDLVNDAMVDVVYVSTTQNFHLRDALRVINAGKHLLLEKPFTLDAAEAERIVAAAKAKGVFVMEAMWTRFLPSMIAAIDVIRSGVIGEPRLITADHSQHLLSVPRLWDNALGGGALLDLGVYPICFIMSLLGAPASVKASAVMSSHHGVDESTSVLMQYPNAQGVGTCSIVTPGPITASIMCTNGRLDLDRSFYEHTTFRVFDAAGALLRSYEHKIEGRGMQFEAQHVEECIRGGLTESPVMPLSESVAVMRVLDDVRAQVGLAWAHQTSDTVSA